MYKYPLVNIIINNKEYLNYINIIKKNIKFNYKILFVNNIINIYKIKGFLVLCLGTNQSDFKKFYNIPVKKILYFKNINKNNINIINNAIMYNYIYNIRNINLKPFISLCTTAYNSKNKIIRAYKSILNQSFKNWEWIILDDSENLDNFNYMKKNFKHDNRIKIFKQQHNGNIGYNKSKVVNLCEGKYILELDHDDEITQNILIDIYNLALKYKNVNFIYSNFSEIYENFDNFKYNDNWALGYGGYYKQLWQNKWINVAISCNINNITMSNIVGVPNHPRIWNRNFLIKIGNYSNLPIADDYELLLKTLLNTRFYKIPKLGYIQYRNNNSNNFSIIRNKEIHRFQNYISKYYYFKYSIKNKLYEQGDKEIECDKIEPFYKRNYEYKESYVNYIDYLDFKTSLLYIVYNKNNLIKILNILKTSGFYNYNIIIIAVKSNYIENIMEEYKIKNIYWYNIPENIKINKAVNYALRLIIKSKYVIYLNNIDNIRLTNANITDIIKKYVKYCKDFIIYKNKIIIHNMNIFQKYNYWKSKENNLYIDFSNSFYEYKCII